MVKCPKCGMEYKNIMGLTYHVRNYHVRTCFHCGITFNPTSLQKHLRLLLIKCIWSDNGKIKYRITKEEKEKLFLACYLQGGWKLRRLLRVHYPKAYENIYKALANKTDLSYLIAPTLNVFYEP